MYKKYNGGKVFCPYCSINPYNTAASASTMEKMVKNGLKLTFRAGQILFYEGHEPNGAFFILSGKVLLKKAPRRKQKMMDAPVWLGFEHVIDGSLYCVTAEAIDKVEAIFIPRKVVLNHMGISEATFTSLVE